MKKFGYIVFSLPVFIISILLVLPCEPRPTGNYSVLCLVQGKNVEQGESLENKLNNKAAVIDFKYQDAGKIDLKIVSDISKTLRESLKTRYDVIPKDEMYKILDQGGYKKDCFTTECLVSAGSILNVDKIFTGSLARVAGILVIEIRIIDMKERKVTIVKSKKCDNIKDVKEFIGKFIEESSREGFLEPVKTEDKKSENIPSTLEEVKKYYGEGSGDLETSLELGVGGLIGYNYLFGGYNNYKDNLILGGECKLRLLSANGIENLSYRLYFDYFPMIVPDGNYNLQEDIFSVNIGAIYNILPDRRFDPFIGIGIGLYLDWIRFDTPASDYISNTYTFFGFNVSVGCEISITKKISIIPESMMHFIVEPGKPVFLARNIGFHSLLIYYF